MAQIWVDADACPVVIKEVLYKAAVRPQHSQKLFRTEIDRPTKFATAD